MRGACDCNCDYDCGCGLLDLQNRRVRKVGTLCSVVFQAVAVDRIVMRSPTNQWFDNSTATV